MSLRTKLLLGLAPLALALAATAWFAVSNVSLLGRHSQLILRENYRSVLAAQRMRESLERLEHLALLSLAAGARPQDEAQYRERFEAELRAAEGNVTEQGERTALQELRRRWDAYQAQLERLPETATPQAAKAVVTELLEPAFRTTLEQAQLILDMNQDAMVRKSEDARREAARVGRVMVPAAVAALLLGILISSLVTRRLLQPFELLARTVARLGEGDLDTRVNIRGGDEVARLANDVNTMATRLGQYRRSSLGELLLAQEASQAAIDSLPDPVVVFDQRGAIINVNHAAETLLGLGFKAGGTLPDAVEPAVQQSLERARAHVLAGKGPYVPRGFEEAVRVTTPAGELYLLPRASPVYSEEGAVSGATVVLQDVTRLRRVDDLRNNLVSTVAHELRTPLTSLRMAIHLCLEQTAGPITEKQADLLHAAREECERLQAMVDELLDLARIQNGRSLLRRGPVAPASLIDGAVNAHRGAAHERQVLLSCEVLPGVPSVLADPERLQLALSNLVSNAIRHTPTGGRITLRAREEDGNVRFEVSDTGAGIAAEYKSSIFDKFVHLPATAEGTGLGLSIAKEIVEAHEGRIGVESVPGEGATFWFTVPVADRG